MRFWNDAYVILEGLNGVSFWLYLHPLKKELYKKIYENDQILRLKYLDSFFYVFRSVKGAFW